MRRLAKNILLILLLLAISGGAWVGYQPTHPPSLAPYAKIAFQEARTKDAELRATFFGVSTLLFEDGQNSILIDGFFTRPDMLSVLTGKISPNIEVIAQSLRRANIQHVDAVIAAHSHYDHAMDSPEVARTTGAILYGSMSTANIGRGWGCRRNRYMLSIMESPLKLAPSMWFSLMRSTRQPDLRAAKSRGRLSRPYGQVNIKRDKAFRS